MMAGDLCLLLAFELLGDCTTDIKVSQAVHKVYSVEIQLCISGQILDYSFGTHINNPTSQDIMKVYTHKTARYTFVVPFTLGALLSKADEKTISQLDMLGEKLGIIYQIKDDELGIYGDEKTIGKPIGSDIRENKKTIFRMLLYSKVTKEEKQYLDNCFGNSEITSQDVEKIKQLLEKYDVINTLHQQIETMYTEIKNQVPQLNFKPQCQQLLVDFIDYTLKRNK
jgi:geranylgeranyl diphosphate synthase type I